MMMRLHKLATTTPAKRAYIQKSKATAGELVRELGVSYNTIARWRSRDDVADRSHRPQRIATNLTPEEERLAVELRQSLALSLDDIVEVLRRCVNPKLSRSGIHRCLKRHGVSARPVKKPHPRQVFDTEAPAGFIHVDLKYLSRLEGKPAYAFVAIDRATRFVYLEIHDCRDGATTAAFLERFLAAFPITVHTILSDNGGEWTDRFAVDKKGKPADRPSGDHPVDRLCARHHITHTLTRPFRPQTNGMVERFNRRIAEHLDRIPHNTAGHHKRFANRAERDRYVLNFVHDYNRTRLRCLDYRAPAEALANLAGDNTGEGVSQQPPRGRGGRTRRGAEPYAMPRVFSRGRTSEAISVMLRIVSSSSA
jgi:transposase InsO family protein